jgi:hypothetical protein
MLSYAEDGRTPAEAQERRILSADEYAPPYDAPGFGNVLQYQVDHGAFVSAMAD